MTGAMKRLGGSVITLTLVAGAALPASFGCSNATEGAVSGAGIGALSGLAIGSLTGSSGTGAAVGAIAGGVGGAVIGDQNRRKEEAATAAAAKNNGTVPPPKTADVKPYTQEAKPAAYTASVAKYSTGDALGNLVGKWSVTGQVDIGDGKTESVSGTAEGKIERTYFVRLDLKFNDPRTGQPVEGMGMISQTGGNGIEMTTSFSSSPEVRTFKGKVEEGGAIMTLNQTDPPAARRMTIRTSAGRGFTAEAWAGDKRVETYTFTPR